MSVKTLLLLFEILKTQYFIIFSSHTHLHVIVDDGQEAGINRACRVIDNIAPMHR